MGLLDDLLGLKRKPVGILEELELALINYPKEYLNLSIVCDFNADNIAPATTGGVNKNEIWRFRIKISNTGVLHVRSVAVAISAKTYISGGVTNQVMIGSTANGPWVDYYFDSDWIEMPPPLEPKGALAYSPYYYFKAPANPSGSDVPLLSAWILQYDHDFLSKTVANTHGGNPMAVFSTQVHV